MYEMIIMENWNDERLVLKNLQDISVEGMIISLENKLIDT
jgi:hypothetical protein